MTGNARNRNCTNITGDVDGVYILQSQPVETEEGVYQREGRLKLKRLSKHLVLVSMSYSVGQPSYNSAVFQKVLFFQNNAALYTCTDDDTCKIEFKIQSSGCGINVIQYSKNNAFQCGFGHGVNVSGHYKRIY